MEISELEKVSRLIRYWILQMTSKAQSGHPTSALSAVELMVGLMFSGVFRYRVDEPEYANNDRLIFSKGHASPLFYALWAVSGVAREEELMTFREFGSRLEGHPTREFPYTVVPTGSLGQGLSVGVGEALAARLAGLNYWTYVLLGDSEMAEGSNWEAMQLASSYKLRNLVGVVDVNRLGQRGVTMYGWDTDNYRAKCEAFGWETQIIDGHDLSEVVGVFKSVREKQERPVMVIAKTVKGKGVKLWENKEGWHSKQLDEEQLAVAVRELGEVDHQLLGKVAVPERISGISNVDKNDTMIEATEFKWGVAKVATKKAAGVVLVRMGARRKDLIVLDGEVSNSTHTDLFQAQFPERFMEMFIAEQNMIGVAVGLARAGWLPVVATFGAFLTRAFDQLRMAGYAQVPMMVLGSYAGVSVGKDGVSQMALEDLAMMRGVWGSCVLYPCDAVATVGIMNAVREQKGIVYIRTTREPVEVIYDNEEKFVVGGSKVVRESSEDVVTVAAAGITLHEALKAGNMLGEEGVRVRVIDLYSVKPIDIETLVKACKETKALVVVEDHFPEGGLAEAVRSALVFETTPIHSLAVRRMPKSGKPEELLAYEEIDSRAIVRKVKEIINS